jgi:hypothetical protein
MLVDNVLGRQMFEECLGHRPVSEPMENRLTVLVKQVAEQHSQHVTVEWVATGAEKSVTHMARKLGKMKAAKDGRVSSLQSDLEARVRQTHQLDPEATQGVTAWLKLADQTWLRK